MVTRNVRIRSGLLQACRYGKGNKEQSFINAKGLQESLDYDMCILVDANDHPFGTATKRDCHFAKSMDESDLPLHRAFSVFIFNDKSQLLIQKRAGTKVTFPGQWSNTCCSHPLSNIDGEMELENADNPNAAAIEGIKRACIRRLRQELGIKPSTFGLKDLIHAGRVHYASFSGQAGWGEHEMDHLLFAKIGEHKLEVSPDIEEVDQIRYITKENLIREIELTPNSFTPWFRLVTHKFLVSQGWWEHVQSEDWEPLQAASCNIMRFVSLPK